MHLRILETKEIEYPFNIAKILNDNPGTSFPREMPDKLLAEYCVYRVEPTPRPNVSIYEVATEAAPAFIDGAWRQQWTVSKRPPPESITPRQCRIILAQQGLLAEVEKMIAAQDEATRITWEYALEFQRDDPLLKQLGAALGLTDEQIDGFFIAAAQI